MKRLAAPASLLALLAWAFTASPAQAASFKRCGSAGTVYSGAVTLAQVGAKRTSCRKARRFARRFTLRSGPETDFTCSEDFYCTWRGWSCRNDGRFGDIRHRCETGNTSNKRVMVVKWVDRTG